MSRRTKDRPLTDAEERALIRLADLRDDRSRGGRESYMKPCRNSTTLSELARRGLVETQVRWGSLDLEARITDEGYTLVRGMGY